MDLSENATIKFINKSKIIHGDKYDYSKSIYINSKTKVIIICKEHGEFEQRPECHINRSSGCPKCHGNVKLTTNEFVTKALQIHGDKYDYSKVNYINSDTKIEIICKEHGIFQQSPNNHINQKNGCPNCGIIIRSELKRKSLDEFIKEATDIHGNKYDYSKVEYKSANTNIIIICKEHGEFKQTPSSHINKNGCNKCSKRYNPTTIEWIQQAKLIHGDKYNYSKVEYKNARKKIIIICKEHGEFEQTMDCHINKHTGCPRCCGNFTLTTEEWIEKAKLIHGDNYNYSKVNYINNRAKVIIICKKHGEFEQIPTNHIQGKGCIKCCLYLYSRIQIMCLNTISAVKNIYIKHAENEGEYTIPNTKFKADGYCEETNTIYEFHGDYWHGNPKLYNPNTINNTTHCTFGELYESTMNKEKVIKELGFNLVTIWESDWRKFISLIRKIQKKFKKYLYNKLQFNDS